MALKKLIEPMRNLMVAGEKFNCTASAENEN
jgi:hypothetical protein